MWAKLNKLIYRNTVFRRAAVIALVLFFLCATLPWLTNQIGINRYIAKQYATSNTFFVLSQFISWSGRDIPMKNSGDALYRQSSYESAAKKYESASKIAPVSRVCSIRYNWSMSISRQAEQLVQSNPPKAKVLYIEALKVILVNNCAENSDYKDSFSQLKENINKEISKLSEDKAAQQSSSGNANGQSQSVEQELKDNQSDVQQSNQYNNSKGSQDEQQASQNNNNYKFVY